MILRISNFQNDVAISDEYIRVLEIEDRALFANIIHSIFALCNDQENKEYIVLIKEGKELPFSKNVVLISDILNFDLNDKKMLNRLYRNIKSIIELDLESLQELELYYRNIFKILDLALLELPFQFSSKFDLEIEDFFKLYSIKLDDSDLSILEKILYFLDLISLLDLCELVVFSNIKSLLTDVQLEEVYKHIIHRKIKALLVEGVCRDIPLKNEKKIRIDIEFDDYEI